METTTSDEQTRSGVLPPKTVAILCERRDSGILSSASNVAMTVPTNRSNAGVSGAAAEGGGGSAEGSAASSLRVPPGGASVVGGGCGGGLELASSAPELNFEPAPLLQEFALLHLSDNLVLEKSDVGDRVIIIVGKAGDHRLRLRIDFPASYPMAKPQGGNSIAHKSSQFLILKYSTSLEAVHTGILFNLTSGGIVGAIFRQFLDPFGC